MTTILVILIVIIVVFVGWNLASRRASLPCPAFLRCMVEMDNPFTRTNRAAEIINHLNPEPGMRVLDAGCGPGRLSVPLARAVGEQGEVVALDLQEGMLTRARENAREAGVENIRFVRAALGEGTLARESFDQAVLVTVLGEIPDRTAALKEIHDALKPGGVLSITEVIFDPHFQRRGTVTRLVTGAGFTEAAFFGNTIAYTIHFKKPLPLDSSRNAW